jgi:enoyl-CoA hydratase/carnithine racemase
MSNSEILLIERDGPLVWLTLNRPERLNAINAELLEKLAAALEAERHSDSKVIILRGAGRAFSAGHDLSSDSAEVTEPGDAVADRDRQAWYIDVFLKIFDHPKPVIAAIHGHCIGGSTQMATFADFVVTAQDAIISASPMMPLGGGFITPLMSYRIGTNRAKLLSFSPGYQISGQTAADWGWAVDSVPADQLWEHVSKLAHGIARTPSSVLRMKKIAINRVLELQGFRSVAYIGAETDVVIHGADEVAFYKGHIEKHGLKESLRAFHAGEI